MKGTIDFLADRVTSTFTFIKYFVPSLTFVN